jgi:hypothetical protein
MDKIPALTPSERMRFYLLHLILIGPPFFYLFYTLYLAPQYYYSLVMPESAQPIGCFFMCLLLFYYAGLLYLGMNSIKNIEKRPLRISIMVMIVLLFLSILNFILIMLLPAASMLITLLLKIILH